MSEISNIVYGLIKHKCIANKVTELNECSVEALKPGTLIHILPEHPGSGCYFMILDFAGTTIYKCSNNDCVVVSAELWPYLLALKKNVGRVKFVQLVNNREFDMDLLKLGRRIRIRWPTGANVKYGEFMVTHNGVVQKLGKGYYIGLQLMNTSIPLTKHLESLTRHYRFGGTGILVTAGWVVLNLYKEAENQIEPPITPQQGSSTSNNSFLGLDELRQEMSTLFQMINRTFKCIICDLIVDSSCGVQLINCNHTVCRTCICDVLLQQSMYYTIPMCPLCQVEIRDEEVCQLAPELNDIFVQNRLDRDRLEPNINLTTLLPGEFDNLLQSWHETTTPPVRHIYKCGFCYQEIEPEFGVTLANCDDTLCRDCISNAILQQAANSVAPNCPVCQTEITDEEVRVLDPGLHAIFVENRLDRDSLSGRNETRSVSPNREHDQQLQYCQITCTFCSETLNSDNGIDVENCGDLWCRNCISNVIEQQIGEGLEPHCLTCQMPFTDDEVNTFGPEVFNVPDVYVDDRQTPERVVTPPGTSNNAAQECTVCLEPCQQRVFLRNCIHPFCRGCIEKWVSEQQLEGNEPTCPVCRTPIELE